MKKLLLLLALPLLIGVGCSDKKFSNEEDKKLSNEEIDAKLQSGEIECFTQQHCIDFGYTCKSPNQPTCLAKGSYWPGGIKHEYSKCGCFDPNKEY